MADATPTGRFADFSRDRFVPLIDGNTIRRLVGMTTEGDDFAWARVDKSEIFELAFNPEENTRGYIDTPNDATFVEKYGLQMDQEIVIDGNNETYSLMYEYAMHFPTGSDAEVPCALIMPNVKDPAGAADAFLWRQAILSPSGINTIDKKLTFSMKFNGAMERGTGAKNETTGRFEITIPTAAGGTPEGGGEQPAALSEEASVLSGKKSTLSK